VKKKKEPSRINVQVKSKEEISLYLRFKMKCLMNNKKIRVRLFELMRADVRS